MIVIPMAGLSSRFFKNGYTVPKYMLKAHGKSLFEWSMLSFQNYKKDEEFVFICRDIFDTPSFIEKSLIASGIENFEIIVLSSKTNGQAETVNLALEQIKETHDIFIFNIDTFRKNFIKMNNPPDGYLEVFLGDGDHWSFILPGENSRVLQTAEKKRISNYCSNGLYYFKNKEIFQQAYEEMLKSNPTELYIAPMYNYLIKSGYKIKYKLVDSNDHEFIGTPEEYISFIKKII